jgi:hypothetical protein
MTEADKDNMLQNLVKFVQGKDCCSFEGSNASFL